MESTPALSRGASATNSTNNIIGDLKKEMSIGQKIFDIFKSPFKATQDTDNQYTIDDES